MYFEPVVGYGTGSYKNSSGGGTTDSVVSPSVGFKFGYFVRYVYLVADARYTIINAKESVAEGSPALTSYGVGIGWDWNLPIRTFFGLDINSSMTVQDSKISGSGKRFALGYYLSLNALLSLEIVSHKLSDDNSGIDVTATQTLITFSFPIEFVYPQTSWKDKVRR